MGEKKIFTGAAVSAAGLSVLSAFPVIGPSAAMAAVVGTAIMNHDRKQELSEKEQLALVEWQVKLAKEYAIARRIDTAEKVTIEEYYEAKGSGKAGASVEPAKKSGRLELNGSGERVTKRVYTFEGVRELTPEEIAQMNDFLRHTSFSQETDGIIPD